MAITNLVEPINERFSIRVNFTSGRFATWIYGNSIKLTLVDGQNLALYRNILEQTYSSAWNAVRGREDRRDGRLKEKSWKSFAVERAFRFMKPSFVDQCSAVMGEEHLKEIKSAMRRLNGKIISGHLSK